MKPDRVTWFPSLLSQSDFAAEVIDTSGDLRREFNMNRVACRCCCFAWSCSFWCRTAAQAAHVRVTSIAWRKSLERVEDSQSETLKSAKSSKFWFQVVRLELICCDHVSDLSCHLLTDRHLSFNYPKEDVIPLKSQSYDQKYSNTTEMGTKQSYIWQYTYCISNSAIVSASIMFE